MAASRSQKRTGKPRNKRDAEIQTNSVIVSKKGTTKKSVISRKQPNSEFNRENQITSQSLQVERINLAKSVLHFPLPDLVEAQKQSYQRFIEEDLVRYFNLINPITDTTGKLWSLEFLEPILKPIKKTELECFKKGLTYDAPLYWKVRLINLQTGEVKEQNIFMGDLPMMTPRGTFIFNGKERVVVHQIVKSEGVNIIKNGLYHNGIPLHQAKVIPYMGPWFSIDTSRTGIISIRLGPRRPKINICTFLRAMGYGADAEILNLFKDIPHNPDLPNFIEVSLAKDVTNNTTTAILDIYKKLRPDVASTNVTAAKSFIDSLLFDPKKIYLGEVGRYQLNKRLEEKYRKEINEKTSVFYTDDIIGITRRLIQANYGYIKEDDIDHLGNRRIRSVNELLGEVILAAIKKIEKNTKDRMSSKSTDELLTAADVISTKHLSNAFRDFFGTSQVSRYMNQKNVLSELSNLRLITISGPGGLTKERATFSVRDVQYSQYGRICVVQTPEGTNIGAVNQLAIYAKINRYGFIEVPYRKVKKFVSLEEALNRIPIEDIYDEKGNLCLQKNKLITLDDIKRLQKVGITEIKVRPFLTGEIDYLDADNEMEYKKTYALVRLDEHFNILDDMVPIRYKYEFYNGSVNEIDYVDVDPAVIAGVNFSLMPLGQHTEAGRTLVEASNMNQAIPLINAEPPIVGTGLEAEVARLSGRSIYANRGGVVRYVDASKVVIQTDEGEEDVYEFITFQPSNDNTLLHHYPVVELGQKINAGDLIADSSSTRGGEISIGTNILTACMLFDGITFEDGFVVSDRLLKKETFTNVFIRTYVREIRETKLGPEELTSDIPGVNESLLSQLDKNGVVRRGAFVKPGDILAGIVAPKGSVELTAEEKLLRAIFGESAYDVKDVSLRMPHGEQGIVIDTQILDKEDVDLGTGVIKQVKIWVAELHEINIGDKLCDFAGQKGVICKIVPEEDMPFLEDGTPVDVIFNPFFLKRMNVSTIKEMHLAMKSKLAGVRVSVPLFSPIDVSELDKRLQSSKSTLPFKYKYKLRDGRTGKDYDKEVAVGIKYFLKLIHIAEGKIHARSTGPYTIVTQQPIGGKAQFGGQRFGEMEVWALEAHGAAYALQEMLTIKSDDVEGRVEAYANITQGEEPRVGGVPNSFKVLIRELRSLCLDVSLFSADGKLVDIDE